MTIFYIDLDGGNDANAGTSWGAAWKTFTNGATAARIAPGDEIRVSKTSDPTSVGTATWTSGKVGNSITFASAPTKQIDTCKSGWVTMGAGSVVTNAQTTAYVTPIAFGGTTVGALQATTTAVTNLAYKALGSTQDFSGYQQVSFWFRSAATFDCTGAQNMFIRLCSDAAGTTVVNTLTMPKWNYQSNMWYPITIDAGSALGSNIQSVSITTTSNTSQTFYFDEMFASPAAGLTLMSLIGLNDNDWHAIKCIRGADVQLLACFSASNALGATPYLGAVDAAWMGTTQTSTTYKLEPSRALLPTTGAGGSGINVTEAGSTSLPNQYRGGWNVSTGLQTGVTFLDNVTHTTSSVGIVLPATPCVIIENFGFVRFTSSNTNNSSFITKDVSFVATVGVMVNNSMSAGFPAAAQALGYTTWGFKSVSGCYNPPMYYVGANSPIPVNFYYGNLWGVASNANTLNLSLCFNVNFTFNNIYPTGSGNSLITVSGDNNNIIFNDFIQCTTNQTTANTTYFLTMGGNGNIVKFRNINYIAGTNPANSNIGGSGNVISISSLSGSGTAFIGAIGRDNILKIDNFTATFEMLYNSSTAAQPKNNKLYCHNFGGVNNYFRVYVIDGNLNARYFELQSTDVYTAGSKAIRYNSASFASGAAGLNFTYDLKAASSAAVANKLVTVTARVKRNSTIVNAGIEIPCVSGFVPGYTSDIITQCTSTGTYELLTLTFTPTADCVFDVNIWFTPVAAGSPDIIWDALTITQAA